MRGVGWERERRLWVGLDIGVSLSWEQAMGMAGEYGLCWGSGRGPG